MAGSYCTQRQNDRLVFDKTFEQPFTQRELFILQLVPRFWREGLLRKSVNLLKFIGERRVHEPLLCQ